MYSIASVLFLSLLASVAKRAADVPLAAPPFAKWTNSELVPNNGVVQRTLKLPASEGRSLTTQYKRVKGNFTCFTMTTPDFQFELSRKTYNTPRSFLK